jgi:hypothetical protein
VHMIPVIEWVRKLLNLSICEPLLGCLMRSRYAVAQDLCFLADFSNSLRVLFYLLYNSNNPVFLLFKNEFSWIMAATGSIVHLIKNPDVLYLCIISSDLHGTISYRNCSINTHRQPYKGLCTTVYQLSLS